MNKKKCNVDKDCNKGTICAFNDSDLTSYCIDNDIDSFYSGCLDNTFENKFESVEYKSSKNLNNRDYMDCINFSRKQSNSDGIENNYMIFRPKRKVFVDTTTINIYLRCNDEILATFPYSDFFDIKCDADQENCILESKEILYNFIKQNTKNCGGLITLDVEYECENESLKKNQRFIVDLNNYKPIIVNMRCPIDTDNFKFHSKCSSLYIDDMNNNYLNPNKSLLDCKNPLYKVPRLVNNTDNYKKMKIKESNKEIKNYDDKINQKLDDLRRLEAEKYIKLNKIQYGKDISMEDALEVINDKVMNSRINLNKSKRNWKIYNNYDAVQKLFHYSETKNEIVKYYGIVYSIEDAINIANKNNALFFVWYNNSYELQEYASKLYFIDIYSIDENILQKDNWVKMDNVTTCVFKYQVEHFIDNDLYEDGFNGVGGGVNGVVEGGITNTELKELYDASVETGITQSELNKIVGNYILNTENINHNIINDLDSKITTYSNAIALNNHETEINDNILFYTGCLLGLIVIIFFFIVVYYNRQFAGVSSN